jgi:BMFP domain-containing protein YqiC
MQSQNRFLDDLARLFGGALATAAGLKREIDELIRLRFERLLGEMNLVTRDEFDAVREMAAKARAEQERLSARLAELEEAGEGRRTPAKPVARRKTAPRKRAAPRAGKPAADS